MRKTNFFLKSIIVIILLFINSIIGYSQSNIWFRTWGLQERSEQGNRVVQTFDGGYAVLTQVALYGSLGTYYKLIKYDYLGNLLWINNIADSTNKILWDMQQTLDSGFIFAGWSSGALLVKTDRFGNLKWQKNYTNLNSGTRFGAVKQTNDLGYIACGSYTDYVNPSGKGIVIKVDSLGFVQWERQYMDSLFNGYGDLLQGYDGNYYITGATQRINPVVIYLILKKLDSVGNVIRNNIYYYSNGGGANITQLKDNSLIVAGINNSTQQPFLAKYDTSGNMKWFRPYPSPNLYFYYMCKDNFDNLIMTGLQRNLGTISLWKFDTSGTILKIKNLSFTGYNFISSTCIKSTIDTGYIITGIVDILDSMSNNRPDVLIVKTDSAFNAPAIVGINNISTYMSNNFKVLQNYPNPFNPKTTLKFIIPNNGYINISIYDLLGKKVFSNREYRFKGFNEKVLDFCEINLCSGVYFIQISFKSNSKLIKVIFL